MSGVFRQYPFTGRKAPWVPTLAAGGTAFFQEVSDGLSLGDSISTSAGFASSIADALALGEQFATIADFAKSLSDALALGESVTNSAAFAKSLADALALGDSSASSAAFAKALSDALSLGDSQESVITFIKELADALGLGDAFAFELIAGEAPPPVVETGSTPGRPAKGWSGVGYWPRHQRGQEQGLLQQHEADEDEVLMAIMLWTIENG